MLSLTQIKALAFSLLISSVSFAQTTIINETFSSSSLPSGWSNSDNAGTGDKWTFNDPGNRNISAGDFSGNYAIIDSDDYGSSSNQKSKLSTPSFDASSYISVTLEFDHQYRDYNGPEFCKVQVYNGSSWTTVEEYVIGDANYNGVDHITLDITTETGGSANAKVRFTYKGAYDWWWAIDNVKITGIEPSIVASPTGPGGVGSGDGSSGLLVWLMADDVNGNADLSDNPSNNTQISSWMDVSGNSNNFTNSGSSRPTVNSTGTYDAVNFDASLSTAQYLNGPSGTHTDASTYFVMSSTNSGKSSSLFDNSSYSLRAEQYNNTNKVGFTHYGIADYSSTITTPYGANSIYSFHKESSSSNLDIHVNNTSSSVNIGSSTAGIPTDRIGKNSSSADEASGDFYEVLMFNTQLTVVEKIIVDNYLSAKFGGISISNDYYTQDNPGSGNFDHNVAGIGRASDGSIHNNSQGTGIIKINNPSGLGLDEYLFWGEDTKNSTYEFSTNSTDYMDRLNSTWRVSMRNDLGTVSVSVAADDLNLTNKQSCTSLKFVVSSSSTFSTKTTYDLTLADGVYTAINVDFDDDDYFTFEYQDVIAVDNATFYNGSGSGGAPNTLDACYKLLVKNTANGTFNISQNANVREVEIETGGLITVDANIGLFVEGDILNNGTVTIEENGSLIQNTTGVNNNSGTGNYIIKRTGNTNPYVYNIWSSPITNADVVSTFSNSNPCDIWVFDRTSQAWSYDFPIGYSTSCNGNSVTFSASDVIAGGDGVMDVCGGYFVPGNTASTKTYDGTVNNGDYTKAISTTTLGNPGGTDWGDDDWNLLGNPYPSGLSAAAFWTENAINNSRITDALYFWDEADTTNGYNEHSDYASWNLLGGLNSGNSNKIPNGNIASGQGFWVVGLANTDVVFNNAMRTNTNNQFFKTENVSENHLAYVSVESPSGKKNNVLVGYNDVTTDGLDIDFDAHKLQGNHRIRLATMLDNEEFSIQGIEKLMIGDKKVIPLLLYTSEKGTHIFTEYKRENLPENIKVYLRDVTMRITHDLSEGPYEVTINGNQTYTNRFELVFEHTRVINDARDPGGVSASTNTSTDVASIDPDNSFTLTKTADGFKLVNPNGVHGNLKVLDVTGKVIWSKTNVSSTQVDINIENISAGFYFVQLIDGTEQVYQQKLMHP